ncbi:MAG TPA: MFS transporter [Micromonosporaceae bacterium]|nr:MFS transporter [Micromonosporaceae bacterium]HCU48800.1 MFS transporter [Micromonosporaceae bacterium]
MRTYRELFRVPEFGALFAAASIQSAGGTISGLALATLVFSITGSALLAALALFGSSFAQVIGAAALLSIADRVPPRRAMVALSLIFTVGAVVLAIPGMPVWGMLLIIFTIGLINSVGGGVRWGLLSQIVPEDGYVLGRSVFNMSNGIMQITGFGVGGILIALISARHALFVSAGLFLMAAVGFRLGLSNHAPRAAGRASIRQTWRVNADLWSHPLRRNVYLALWVPSGLVVGCEALFVAYAPDSAGVLFMAAALGMLVGDTVTGRLLRPIWRAKLISPMRLLLAAPYLLFVVAPPMPIAVVAVAVASVGFSATLMLQERLLALVPLAVRGQALGLHSSGMLTMQAIGATVAGSIAEYLQPATAIVVMATASLAVTIALTPRLRVRIEAASAENLPGSPQRST